MVIINWLMAHQAVLGGVVVAVLDLIFALIPSWQSDGILHSIYLFFQKLAKPQA